MVTIKAGHWSRLHSIAISRWLCNVAVQGTIWIGLSVQYPFKTFPIDHPPAKKNATQEHPRKIKPSLHKTHSSKDIVSIKMTITSSTWYYFYIMVGLYCIIKAKKWWLIISSSSSGDSAGITREGITSDTNKQDFDWQCTFRQCTWGLKSIEEEVI